ncbi:hypothetical protein [Vibrio sp. Evd11]|uniref:hypothetical protein n=1 Tax=Vibrio sp. Evd11 TaxID=1207404 RepID=UPI000EFA5684|nr:hypothetical protein [Vibrio sp. Evd11]
MDLSNISKALGKNKPFLGTIDTELGELAVYLLRVKGIKALSDQTGDKSIGDFSAESYIQMLISVLAHPVEKVLNDEEPEKSTLPLERIMLLGEKSLNQFSKLFLEHHDYLYREKISESKKKEDGTPVWSLRYGDTIHPQNEDEQPYEYLYRLLVIEDGEQQERRREVLGQFASKSLLSSHLNSQFETSTAIGAALSDRVKSLTTAASLASEITQPISAAMASIHQPALDISSIARANHIPDSILNPSNVLEPSISISNKMMEIQHEETARKHKQEHLNERQEQHLGAMVESMSESVEYMRRLDDNQRLATEESKQASKDSSEFAIRGIKLNKWVLALTVIGLLSSAYVDHSGSDTAEQEIQVVKDGFSKLSESFENLANAVEETNRNEHITETALSLQKENTELKALIEKQSQRISVIESQQAEQVKALQEQLNALRSANMHKQTSTSETDTKQEEANTP